LLSVRRLCAVGESPVPIASRQGKVPRSARDMVTSLPDTRFNLLFLGIQDSGNPLRGTYGGQGRAIFLFFPKIPWTIGIPRDFGKAFSNGVQKEPRRLEPLGGTNFNSLLTKHFSLVGSRERNSTASQGAGGNRESFKFSSQLGPFLGFQGTRGIPNKGLFILGSIGTKGGVGAQFPNWGIL